ncbi:MAG TPA: CidA/LrgA family protein [Tepidisphaeraceae bacterium]|jgi:holin-like protein|nr:CidA/LrgA family protein [Tepidisphaeraceae bacterium]
MAILLGFNLIGVLLQRVGGVPLPGAVLGLVLFAIALFLGIIKLNWVEAEANVLLRHMLLFFAPVIVGIVGFRQLLTREWLPISIGLVGSWLAVIVVTGLVAKWMVKR